MKLNSDTSPTPPILPQYRFFSSRHRSARPRHQFPGPQYRLRRLRHRFRRPWHLFQCPRHRFPGARHRVVQIFETLEY
ncbi:unnamed protein product [Ixodes pacificus]